jgi:hypothetical protein
MTTLPPSCAKLSTNVGASSSWSPKGLSRHVMGLLYLSYLHWKSTEIHSPERKSGNMPVTVLYSSVCTALFEWRLVIIPHQCFIQYCCRRFPRTGDLKQQHAILFPSHVSQERETSNSTLSCSLLTSGGWLLFAAASLDLKKQKPYWIVVLKWGTFSWILVL